MGLRGGWPRLGRRAGALMVGAAGHNGGSSQALAGRCSLSPSSQLRRPP